MADARRDEGLDKLEAFIALLDAAHERIESGADRLDSVAGELARTADDLESEAQRLDDFLGEHGDDGALMLTPSVVSTFTGLIVESTAGVRSAREVHDDIAQALDGTAVYAEASVERLAEFALALAISGVRIQSHLLYQLVLGLVVAELEASMFLVKHAAGAAEVLVSHKDDAIALAKKVPVVYTSIVIVAVMVESIVSLIVPMLTIGVLILALIAVSIADMLERTAVEARAALDDAEEGLRAAGFGEAADRLEALADADWVTLMLIPVKICGLILLIIGTAVVARTVAITVLVLGPQLKIASSIVHAVDGLLKALNPFD